MLEVKRSILLFDIYNINTNIILYLLNPTKREELTIILQKMNYYLKNLSHLKSLSDIELIEFMCKHPIIIVISISAKR